MINKEPALLVILPIINFEMGENLYQIHTPKDGTLHFKTKQEAREFLQFYHEYTKRVVKIQQHRH